MSRDSDCESMFKALGRVDGAVDTMGDWKYARLTRAGANLITYAVERIAGAIERSGKS